MRKYLIPACFLAVSLCLCLILSIGMLFAGPSRAGANEQLAGTPAAVSEEGRLNLGYLSELIDWVRDHFFLRQELISVDHWLSAKLFHTSGDAGVILGSDGWLYYADTVSDYTGTDSMTQRELFASAYNLRLMADYCRGQGRDFLFVIAPNKNSLYPEHMPNYGALAETTDAERLMALLDANGVNTVDLFQAFRQESRILYFAHDSHWNTMGAALGADRINAAFGVPSHYYTAGDFSQRAAHTGDLFTMLYPAFPDTEEDVVYGGTLSYSFTTSATRPDAIVLNTEGSGQKTLLAYRDSFGNLLFPFLADSFAAARFSRSTSYDLTKDADCVLVELVERNLPYLIQNIPVMPAPQVSLSLPDAVSGTVAATASTRGDWLQVRGQLPAADTDAPVYVVCGGIVYEAFCLEDNGFGICLEHSNLPEYVLCAADGTPVMYQLEISE